MPVSAAIHLTLFGRLELDRDERTAALLSQPRRAALVAYLAAARPFGFQRRDRLVALFWPEHRQEHARAALRKAVWSIRQLLGDDALVSRGDEELQLDPALLQCDVREMADALASDHLARALELYRGPFLDGFFAEAPELERWAAQERERYREAAAECAWTLADRYERGRDLTSATRWARRAAELSAGADERVLRRVLTLLHRAGDRAGAVRVYDSFARRLREEFDVAPSAETEALIRQVRIG